jgi:chitin disaccharide deacetylase
LQKKLKGAEGLGMKRLIVNADDFGWDNDTFDATIELIERGWITSATIMTGCPATGKALNYAKRKGESVSFGLHFNIVDGHQPLNSVPSSLVGANGQFRNSHHQRIAALAGFIKTIDVAKELRAQLSILRQAGVPISHVDSHGHLHKYPVIGGAMVPVLREFGIKKMRRVQDTYTRRSVSDLVDAYCAWRFPTTVATTDHYYALDRITEDWFERLHETLKPGITELSVHPGQSEGWRRSECAPFQKQDSADVQFLGIKLITYHDL